MRGLRVACGTVILGLCACAPVQSKTHFQRWDEYASQVAAEEAKSPSEAPADVAAPAGSPGQPRPAATTAYDADPTPPITGTSTGSRVVRPAETPPPSDDDVIY